MILVTGGAGFIGSHIVDALAAGGEEVVILDSFDAFYARAIKEENLAAARDHRNVTVVEGDIRDRDRVHGLPDGIDTIVHLAARAGVRPSLAAPVLYADVNVLGTSVLLDFARERGIESFVFASSSSVYGNNDSIPFREDDRVDHPISPYASTKKAGELLCHTQAHLYGTSCVCLRFFTVYGPRQRPDLAIRKFSARLLAGEPIPRYGDGSTARDYTYVTDIVDGVVAAVELARSTEGRYDVINLGESRTVRLSEMIGVLANVLDRTPVIEQLPTQPGDVERTYADVSRAREILGYAPSVDFEDGARAFAEWYLAHGARQDGVPGFA